MNKDKIINNLNRYLEYTIERRLRFIEKLVNLQLKILNIFKSCQRKIMQLLVNILSLMVDAFYFLSLSLNKLVSSVERKVRIITVPVNYFYFLYLKKRNINKYPFLQSGTHYFYALQGGGKSSIAYNLIDLIRKETGKNFYVTCNLEFPKTNDYTRVMTVKNAKIDLPDYFGEVYDVENDRFKIQQKKAFDSKNFCGLFIDELLGSYNHRLNNTKDYNKVILGLVQASAQQRHQGLKYIYIASQLDTADIQLMGLFKYQHEVAVDLDIPYLEWVDSGMLTSHIMGWTVNTYHYKRDRKSRAINRVLFKKTYLKATADFDYFNSLNMADFYDNLPQDKYKLIRS